MLNDSVDFDKDAELDKALMEWMFDDDRKESYNEVIERVKREKEGIETEYDRERNIKRDWHGRVTDGSRLAQQDRCDKDKIWQLRCSGMPVKEIVKYMGCSKSTVYNAIKEHREKMGVLPFWNDVHY